MILTETENIFVKIECELMIFMYFVVVVKRCWFIIIK